MFKIVGKATNQKVKLNIDNIQALTRQGVRRAFYNIGKDLKRDSVKKIRSNRKTGRVYTKRLGGRIVLHRASAPGEYPANFTGNLAKNIKYRPINSDKLEFGVSSKLNYGKFLERGTFNMKPRPFLLPTIRGNFNKIEVHFNTQIKNHIQGLKF